MSTNTQQLYLAAVSDWHLRITPVSLIRPQWHGRYCIWYTQLTGTAWWDHYAFELCGAAVQSGYRRPSNIVVATSVYGKARE